MHENTNGMLPVYCESRDASIEGEDTKWCVKESCKLDLTKLVHGWIDMAFSSLLMASISTNAKIQHQIECEKQYLKFFMKTSNFCPFFLLYRKTDLWRIQEARMVCGKIGIFSIQRSMNFLEHLLEHLQSEAEKPNTL